jgi:hypothetical protein
MTTNPTVPTGQQLSQTTITATTASTAVALTITINLHSETLQDYLNTLFEEQAKCLGQKNYEEQKIQQAQKGQQH